MFNSGFLTVGQFGGAPVRLHWSIILLMLWFGGWQPGAWVGIVIVLLVHELGHAMVVRAVGATTVEVMVYGFGGYCRWSGDTSSRQRALIAWGGVWAQAVLLAIAWTVRQTVPVYDLFTLYLLNALTRANLAIILFNLIPFEPLDGATAWRLIPMLRDDVQSWWRGRRKRAERAGQPKAKEPAAKPPEPAKAEESAPPPAEASEHRISDPAEAERVFQRMYDDMFPRGKPADAEAPDDADRKGND